MELNKKKLERDKIQKYFTRAVKIAIGSCVAILIAEFLGLEFAASAGIITLLTIVSTRWGTLKLSGIRILTFFISVAVAWIVFQNISSEWVAFGVFIFVVVFFSNWKGWADTISVNAVIGTHFLTTHDFSLEAILNEFLLVVIGSAVAIVLNLIHNNRRQKNKLIEHMRYVEAHLKAVLEKMAKYLYCEDFEGNVWDDIIALEHYLEHAVDNAYHFNGNTFTKHHDYYIHYFEMRTKQCNVLHNLHYEMKKIRSMPKQAGLIAFYINYLKDFVTEMNVPEKQLHELEQIFEIMGEQPLPTNREEFEGRAILYHILMDLEEFLVFKKRFVDSLNEKHIEKYWRDSDEIGDETE